MIDWLSLSVNALWLIAAALSLSALSFASWQAAHQGEKLRTILSSPGYRGLFDLAGVLVCISGGFTAPATWLKLIWLGMGLVFGLHILASSATFRRLFKK